MKRRLSDMLAGLSLLLCAAVLVLWVRSYHVAEEVDIRNADFRGGNPWTVEFGSERGMVWARRYRIFGDGPLERVFVTRTPRDEFWGDPAETEFLIADAPVDPGRSPKSKGYRWRVCLPHWAVALVLLAPPLWRLNHHRVSRRRRASGLCLACGYDLRATPDGRGTLLARCPECGAVAANAHAEPPPLGAKE